MKRARMFRGKLMADSRLKALEKQKADTKVGFCFDQKPPGQSCPKDCYSLLKFSQCLFGTFKIGIQFHCSL